MFLLLKIQRLLKLCLCGWVKEVKKDMERNMESCLFTTGCVFISASVSVSMGEGSLIIYEKEPEQRMEVSKKRKKCLTGRCHTISAGELMTPLTADSQRALQEACEGDL